MDGSELKHAIKHCAENHCIGCMYRDDIQCVNHIMSAADSYIAELEERIAIMQESMEALEKRLADHDRIKVIRCADCAWWEANNAEEGDTSGYCRKNAECENALTDMTFFCGSADRR